MADGAAAIVQDPTVAWVRGLSTEQLRHEVAVAGQQAVELEDRCTVIACTWRGPCPACEPRRRYALLAHELAARTAPVPTAEELEGMPW